MSLPFSLLDLSHVLEGGVPADSFRHSAAFAQKAETLDYARVWYAEHHNIPGVASSATSVLIGHIAGLTKTIRLGAGGIMLPNHSPLVIAEQFGTLATLYGDRFDLGLGRAPGGDQNVIRALRKDYQQAAHNYPQDVLELIALLSDPAPDAPLPVRAIPGEGTNVPVWILGSSLFSAQMAAHYGLPYAFASHFAPQQIHDAARIYRASFKPSAHRATPYFMVACNIFAADTEAEAKFQFSTLLQAFLNIMTNQRGLTPKPRENVEVPAAIQPRLAEMLRFTAIGTPQQVASQLARIIDTLAPDEIICSMPFHDQAARLRSLELAMDARALLAEKAAA